MFDLPFTPSGSLAQNDVYIFVDLVLLLFFYRCFLYLNFLDFHKYIIFFLRLVGLRHSFLLLFFYLFCFVVHIIIIIIISYFMIFVFLIIFCFPSLLFIYSFNFYFSSCLIYTLYIYHYLFIILFTHQIYLHIFFIFFSLCILFTFYLSPLSCLIFLRNFDLTFVLSLIYHPSLYSHTLMLFNIISSHFPFLHLQTLSSSSPPLHLHFTPVSPLSLLLSLSSPHIHFLPLTVSSPSHLR